MDTSQPIAQTSVLSPLRRLDGWVIERERAVLVAMLFLIALGLSYGMVVRPLGHDEIYTRLVSGLGSPLTVFHALKNGADVHPPADYMMRNVVLHISDHPFMLRLPSLAAFLGFLVCLFRIGNRVAGRGAGLLAASLGVQTLAMSHSIDARSYIVGLFLFTWALLCWMEWEEPGRQWLRVVVVAGTFFTSPLLHYYFPFWLVGIGLGELVWTWQHRRIRKLLWLSFAPLVAGVLVTLPFMLAAKQFTTGFWTPVTVSAMWALYGALGRNALLLMVAMLVAGFWLAIEDNSGQSRSLQTHLKLPLPVAVVLSYLTLLPVVLLGVAKLTHAYSARYGFAAVVGIVMGMMYLIRRPGLPLVACSVACALLVGAFKMTSDRGFRQERLDSMDSVRQVLRKSELPLVLESSNLYLETRDLIEPELRDRILMVGDPEVALKYTGTDSGIRAILGLRKFVPLTVYTIAEFEPKFPKVRVYHEGGSLAPWGRDHGYETRLEELREPFLFEMSKPPGR